MKTLSLRLDDDTYERLRTEAFEKRTTITALIRDALSPAHDAEIRRDQAEKLAAALRARLQRPVRPYGDSRIRLMPEVEFARDAYGDELFDDIEAILAQFTPSPETEQEPSFLYARCDGSGRCSALYHVHGCFTEHGRDACDTPDAHDSGETE